MTNALPSKSVSDLPGDTLRVLTRDVTAMDGTILRAGTEYRPVSAGMHGLYRRYTHVISVDGGKYEVCS